MPIKIPPAPTGTPFGSYTWADWYFKVREMLNNADFDHNSLLNLQGGSLTERYHLTQAEYERARNAMSIKRIIRANMYIDGSNTFTTYTISPAISDLQKAQLFFLGCKSDNSIGDIMIELTDATTITASKTTTSGNSTVSFELVEYN